MTLTWENESRAARWWNTERPLTHSLDQREEGLAMQATRICSVADCDQPHFGLGFCRKHYNQQNYAKRAVPGGRKYPPRTFCEVDSCGRPTKAHKMCGTHYQRFLRTGSPLVVRVAPHFAGAEHPNWRGTDISYGAAHRRVWKTKGSASLHLCVDCSAPANHWSYDHRDPNELMRPGPAPYVFSADPAHYEARCAPCHVGFDAAWRRATGPDGASRPPSAPVAAEGLQSVPASTPEPLEAP